MTMQINLKEYRKQAGLTQEQVVAALHHLLW